MLPSATEQKPRKVNILVCSANMGNAEPDVESLAAWIPKDGNVKEVLENPRYPLPEGTNPLERRMKTVVGEILKRKLKKAPPTPIEVPPVEEQKQFDIVVIGMQEATFEVVEESTHMKLLPSQAIKAQRAVSDLTKAKDHLGKGKERNRLGVLSQSLGGGSTHGKNVAGSIIGLGGSILGGSDHGKAKGSTKPPPFPKKQRAASMDAIPASPAFSGRPPRANAIHTPITNASSSIGGSEHGSVDTDTGKAHVHNDTRVLHELLQAHLPSYEHAVSYQRGQMRLMIFFNSEEISLDVISTKAQNTGKGGLANKGGIVSEVLVDGTTRLAFFTAHLEAHEGQSKYETRCSSVADIFRGTTSSITQCRCDASLASHFTFAMGDLNFRTRLPDLDPGSNEHISTTHAMVGEKEWDELYKHDELSKAIENNHCFSGFSTPVCSFPPTFKVDRQKGYAYNEKRSPSYTDRILYTTGHRLDQKLKVLAYEPIDNFASSDHKPIRGAFEVELNPRLRWRPTLSSRETKRASLANGITHRISRFRRMSTHIAEKPKKADQREYLNIFVSSVHVRIDQALYKKSYVSDGSTPSPFVCFVSTPAEALKRDTNSWEKLVHTLNPSVGKNLTNSDGTKAWPRTRPKRNTFDAFWENEEIHFKVRTHTNEGLPIDLSGAMIHLAVFDGKSSGKLVGTFSLNLAHLITQSRQERTDLDKTRVEPRKSASSGGGSVRALFGGSGRALVGRSVMNLFSPGRMTREKSGTAGRETSQSERSQHSIVQDEAPEESEKNHTDDESENLNGNGSRPQKSAEPPQDIPQDLPGREKNDGNMDEKGENNDKKEAEPGVLTSGPSAELLRRATSKWLAVRKTDIGSATNVHSMKLSRPLRKYGQHVGTILCTIDAWWLSDEAAQGKKKSNESDSASLHMAGEK